MYIKVSFFPFDIEAVAKRLQVQEDECLRWSENIDKKDICPRKYVFNVVVLEFLSQILHYRFM